MHVDRIKKAIDDEVFDGETERPGHESNEDHAAWVASKFKEYHSKPNLDPENNIGKAIDEWHEENKDWRNNLPENSESDDKFDLLDKRDRERRDQLGMNRYSSIVKNILGDDRTGIAVDLGAILKNRFAPP